VKGRYAVAIGVVAAAIVGCSLVDWAQVGTTSDASGDAPLGDGGTWSCESVTPDPDIKQTLPQLVPVTFPSNTHVVAVAASDNLQAKISAALPGDILELEAGATFTGPFKLPAYNGTGWIVIRTAGVDQFAPAGVRVSPTTAAQMAKLVAPSSAVVTLANGANGWRLVGLEIAPATQAAPVDLSAGGVTNIVLDRLYTHGGGLVLQGGQVALIDSYASGASSNGWAITINGGGPMRITNDAILSASGSIWIENGNGYAICQNAISGDGGSSPSGFQINTASNVLIAGNVVDTNGTVLNITQGGATTTTNITMAYNHTTRVGQMYVGLANGLTNVVIHDNLFDSIPPVSGVADVRLLGNTGTGSNVKLDHNTFTTGSGELMSLGQQADYVTNFFFTNNFGPYGANGVIGNSDAGFGTNKGALDIYFGTYSFTNNAIWGNPGSAPSFPPGNYFPANEQAVGFDTDWSLLSSSTYKNLATDGVDIGADIATVTAATKNVP
jgi:hypothetical protein